MGFFKDLFQPDNNAVKITRAFPAFLKDDVLSLLEKASLKTRHEISQTFEVSVDSEKLEIPYRIYFEEPDAESLTETERLILNCLFTRHHDGFVRQRSLRKIIRSDEYWTTPFIVRLLGEYVREILSTIEENLTEELIAKLIRFIGENPKFFETTKKRVVSYWDCYYRRRKTDGEIYVGFRILSKIPSPASFKIPSRRY